MLEVVKPGGYVLLRHYENEAETANYEGFHQWNFCVDDGHFIIWNPESRLSVNDNLGDAAEVTATTETKTELEDLPAQFLRKVEVVVSLREHTNLV
jgi:hypothetical protein